MDTVASKFNDLFYELNVTELSGNRIEDLIYYQENPQERNYGKLSPCRLHIKNYCYQVMLIQTRFGNMVVYQESHNQSGPVKYVCDNKLDYILGFEEMILGYNDFNRLFHPTENVGVWLEKICRLVVENEV